MTSPSFICFILLIATLQRCLSIVYVPHTPCPDVFNYHISQTEEVFARIRIKNDLSGEYRLELNMTIPIETDETIRITQRTSNLELNGGSDVVYIIGFPDNTTFPTVTSIMFNGRLHCIEKPLDARKITNLSASSYVSTKYLDVYRWAQPDLFRDINKYPDECGINVDFESFVINGTSVRNGEFPWLIGMLVFQNKVYNFQCGGTLVTERHVVTAAHCVRDLRRLDVDKKDVVVVLGTKSIKNWVKKSTWRGVARIAVHEDYIKPGDADVAVLVLDKPVKFSVNIKPICIWEEDNSLDVLVGRTGFVAGWGKNENNEGYVVEAKQVSLPVVAQATCLLASPKYYTLTSRRTFCAGYRNYSLPCTGDSGGGFVMKHQGRWTLRGIVSAGITKKDSSLCDSTLYAVFADATKFRKWITEQTNRTETITQ